MNPQTNPENQASPQTNPEVLPAAATNPSPVFSPQQPIDATPQTQSQPVLQSVVSQAPVFAQTSNLQFNQPLPVDGVPKEATNAPLLILQWLTYAFWGWTILALSILTTTVVASLIRGAETGGFTPFGIAAVLVLLPISYVCDSFYSKKEPAKKIGAAMWVMVIHAVIFALFGIGALISTVVSLVMLFVNSSSASDTLVWLVSGFLVTIFYGATFLRTLRPEKLSGVMRHYKMFMLVLVGLIALLGVLGPMAKERTTRDDRLISDNIGEVSRKIDDYAQSKNRLPTSLSDLNLSTDEKKLVDRKLMTYKPEGSAPASSGLNVNSNSSDSTSYDYNYSDQDFASSSKTFRYQLCVKYTAKSSDYGSYSYSSDNNDEDGYAYSLNAYEHPAGDVCYKQKTYDY